jgi:hypothetical protein
MDVEIGRHGLLDLGKEVAEFDCAVRLVAAADDPAGGNVQGGEQRGRAVLRIIMAAPLGLPRGCTGNSSWRDRVPGSVTSDRRIAPGHGRAD